MKFVLCFITYFYLQSIFLISFFIFHIKCVILRHNNATIMLSFCKIALCMAVAAAAAVMAEPNLPRRTVNGREYYYYEVPSKETIYSIGRKFGYTRDEIIRHNPQVKDGLRAGDTLFFPVEIEEVEEEVEEPVPAEVEIEEPAKPEEILAPEPEPEPEAEPEVVEEEVVESLNVAVVLPFMLQAENMTRQAENNTHFYQGMLLALNDLAATSDSKVSLSAFDSAASADTVTALLPELAYMDYVIAPSDSASIERIAIAADRGDTSVLNLFGVKYAGEERHESVIQANVPRDDMYAQAVEAFCERYARHHVLIAHPTDVKADKSDFVQALVEALVKNGIPYEQINFEGRLSPELIAELPEKDYVVVPTGASRESLLRVMPTLIAYQETHPEASITLFGYPEWVAHRGEIKDNLHKLNTVVYSRFSTDLDSPAARQVRASYKQWFGQELPQAVPNTVLLGYDTMAWIISAADNGLTEPYEGVQNSFKITPAKAGNANRALYLLRFNSNGSIDAQAL